MSAGQKSAMDPITIQQEQQQHSEPLLQQQQQRPPLLDHQCSHCFISARGDGRTTQITNLYICSGCRVVRYCSRDHQILHWAVHKPLCLPVKRSKALAESEERKIRMNPGSFRGRNGAQEGWEAFYMPGDPFEHAIDFWEWEATRVYMQARWGIVDGLRRINTTEALEWALGHSFGVLQLNRSDDLGMRFVIPAMMIRLGNDQEAYDFVKWWAIYADKEFDWGDPDAPYMHLHGENIMEDLDLRVDAGAQLTDQVVVLLLKLRLFLNRKRRIREILTRTRIRQSNGASRERQSSADSKGESPTDSSSEECLRDPQTPTSSFQAVKIPRSSRTVDRLTRDAGILRTQLETLRAGIQHRDSRLLPLLAAERVPPAFIMNAKLEWNTRAYLTEVWSKGSGEEMQLIVQWTYDAWAESPGALEWLREQQAMENAA